MTARFSYRLFALLMGSVALAGGAAYAQDATGDAGTVIRTETKLVLVDAVVTDKKGDYVKNLAQKDFKVWEDNKEQTVKSFSFQSDPALAKAAQRRYIVLFFDNSTMDSGAQARAREAAGKFIDANAGPNRMMAIVNFGGAIQIAQNFTDDAERLKQIVSGVKLAAVTPNVTDPDMPTSLAKAASDFGAHDMLLALRSLAKNLNTVSGRKTLILFTEGFPLNVERMSEITAAIDTCNKSNVAVYPIDVRGLVAPTAELYTPFSLFPSRGLVASTIFLPPIAFFQRGGGGGGGAGGGGAGGGGGGRGGAGNGGGGPAPAPGGGAPGGGRGGTPTSPNNSMNNPNNPNYLGPNSQARNALLPKIPESTIDNQNMMHMLADGTGGFVIKDTNDLFAGLQKIGQEMDDYYILGYTPPESAEGSCHTLRVKVDQNGDAVRFRTGYCNVRPRDALAGSSVEKTLESRVTGSQAGNIAATMELPFFYTGPNQARVNVAMEIPGDALKFDKQKGKFQGEMNVLGIAYNADGSVGARFSDTLKREFDDKKEVDAFEKTPFHYENQFEIASGTYNLKVVFSAGGTSFGKIEAPLKIEPWSTQFALSSLALSKEFRQQSALSVLDSVLIEDRVPLISRGVQVVPYGSDKFVKAQPMIFYTEIYEPLLLHANADNKPLLGLEIRILDRKTRMEKFSTGLMRLGMEGFADNNPTLPLAERIPLDSIGAGQYVLEVEASDSAGRRATRVADFELQ